MATKTANLYARIEPDVKAQAEFILSSLGIPVSNAINIFYKQIILHRGIPFPLTLPKHDMLDIGKMTEMELDSALEQGYDDMLDGHTKPAKQAFSDIRRDYKL